MSVKGKGGKNSVRYEQLRRMQMNHRRSVDKCNRCRNQGLDNALGQIRQKSEFRSGDIRHRGSVTIAQALVWNLGICRFDVKGVVQAENLQELEYRCDRHRGGVMHSSYEGAVMALERRRGLIRRTEDDNFGTERSPT